MQFYWADGFAVKNNSRKLSGIPFAFDLNPSRGYFQLFLHLINVLSIVNARKFISRSPHYVITLKVSFQNRVSL